jgi:hypothetical protein
MNIEMGNESRAFYAGVIANKEILEKLAEARKGQAVGPEEAIRFYWLEVGARMQAGYASATATEQENFLRGVAINSPEMPKPVFALEIPEDHAVLHPVGWDPDSEEPDDHEAFTLTKIAQVLRQTADDLEYEEATMGHLHVQRNQVVHLIGTYKYNPEVA